MRFNAGRLTRLYRRTGADVPFGDPVPSHRCEMEGCCGPVAVAVPVLAGDGTVVALHPGGLVRSAALDDARAEQSRVLVNAGTAGGDSVAASGDSLHVELYDVELDLRFASPYVWPKASGGGGLSSSIPFLNQYWHPYRLGGKASGSVSFGSGHWLFDNATLYAERNWGRRLSPALVVGAGARFPRCRCLRCVSGGLPQLGPIGRDVTGLVIRLGARLIRITSPARVRSAVDGGRWTVRARSPRYEIDLDGEADGLSPHALPVPLPAERRNVDTDLEHLAARLHCRVREFGRVLFDGASKLAGLETGSLP